MNSMERPDNRKRRDRERRAVDALLVVATLILCEILAGCSADEELRTKAGDFTEKTGPEVWARWSRLSEFRPDAAPLRLTFVEALRLAVDNNITFQMQLLKRKEYLVGKEQAESIPLPRLDLSIVPQFPIGIGSPDSKEILLGGISLHYDLVEVLFSGEAIAGAEARITRSEQEAFSIVRNLGEALYRLVIGWKFHQEELALRSEALDLYRKRYDQTRTLVSYGKAGPESLRQCQVDLQTADMMNQAAREAVDADVRQIKKLLGLSPSQDIAAIELPELESEVSGKYSSLDEVVAELKEAWSVLPEVRIAELDLFLAELRIAEAGRGRLPSVAAGTRFGATPLAIDNDTAPVVLGLDITYPLLDWGDTTRRQTVAEIARDAQKIQMVQTARDFAWNMLESYLSVQQAHSRWKEAEKNSAQLSKVLSSEETLLKFGKIGLSDYYSLRLTRINAAITLAGTRQTYENAVLNRSFVACDFPSVQLCQDIIDSSIAMSDVDPALAEGERVESND